MVGRNVFRFSLVIAAILVGRPAWPGRSRSPVTFPRISESLRRGKRRQIRT